MRGVIAAHGGVEVGTEGDAFFVVFTSPAAAVRAAVEAQQFLSAECLHPRSTVRVRMGLHTGEAVLGGDNYIGIKNLAPAQLLGPLGD
jgi:class 3 adenylate cyclase